MNSILQTINDFYANIVPIGDAMWGFPTNFEWYTKIPILGNFTFAVLLLLGMGIFFSIKFNLVQFRFFKRGLKSLMKKKRDETGVTPLAAFMLSTAMRVGPGNIIGVLNNWKDEFYGYYHYGLCYVLQIDPQTIGNPGRIGILEELFEYMSKFEDIWFATGKEMTGWEGA
ncbi:hypothetical protein [Sinanaerobacter sp. ZZT-01]|uniref:hypothetical protein n=1 Tax=Sinanaerobacter sp. ZZT-01 TaxID=3111540 RepID=UPI002D7988E5|nr:hypothetical protein [Sinanaerobacter sp. ZZT-01]WRR95032.1 hypothetical protein U5921_07885 [Sinanaerobacter sp. ZZT-01]